MKKCTKCGVQKPLSEFYKNKNLKNGFSYHCKLCVKQSSSAWYDSNKKAVIARSKKWAKENKEQKQRNARNSHVKRKYGITFEQEQEIKNLQDGKCPICKVNLEEGYKTHIDHCHTTGRIRGVLCYACNVLLGHARESVEILQSAQRYLKKFSQKTEEK